MDDLADMKRYPTAAVRTTSRRVGSQVGVRSPLTARMQATRAAKLPITRYAGTARILGSRRLSGHHQPSAAHRPPTATRLKAPRAHGTWGATHPSVTSATTPICGMSQRQILWLARIQANAP